MPSLNAMIEACRRVQSHGKVLVDEALGTGSSSTWLLADLWLDGNTPAVVMGLNRFYML